jgi:hypothetical protein
MKTGLTSNRSFEMNRRTAIAALVLVGAASFTAAPSYAQTSSALLDAKIPHEMAAPQVSGAVPRVSPLAGATQGAAAQEALAGSAPALQQAPASSLLKK